MIMANCSLCSGQATGWIREGFCFRSRMVHVFFIFRKDPDQVWGPTCHSFLLGPFLEKRPGAQADHSPLLRRGSSLRMSGGVPPFCHMHSCRAKDK
jgi:hypothetical protein